MDDARKPVTILFTDIVGSTAHAEKLDPEEWKEIVNGAHRRVTAAVTRYEGTIAQFLGDGVLAFFGAPVAHEDDPARAVNAGLEIQREITEYARELRGYVDEFQMRVGINTGQVVVGAVGSADHAEYLAVGDAVNLAARLQSAAQPGTVLISEATARLVQVFFDLHDLGEISVKGKAEPLRVFEVSRRRAGFADGRGIPGLISPLVGRERELAQLVEALEHLRAGDGQIVFVLGEAGIGKSRLVEEARLSLHKSPIPKSDMDSPSSDVPLAIRFLEGRALSYGQSLSFWMITQLLQSDLGLGEGEPEPRIRVTLRRRVTELFADRTDEVLPYLAHLLAVKLEGESAERVKSLDGETLKHQTLISIAEYFTKLAKHQPTVLILEDLHWADPSSLEALERLLRITERAPLMLVVLMRTETDKPAWRIRDIAARDSRRRFRELELQPLSPDDSQELVNNLLTISDFPGAMRRLIFERAEGNPFYLEEIIRSLIEQGGILRDAEGHWRAQASISALQIPDTLQALLLARIDRLQDDVKRTLQLASVIGRSFLYKLLEAISDAERELDWHVAQLERADLVHEKARLPELEYIFKHSLTQEAAYESLLLERRKEFHRRVANALETLFADRQDEFLGLLAHHFDRAGEKEKAVDYLIRAGDKTRLSDAHQEAIGFYERARDLLLETGDLGRASKTWLKLGLIYHANFEFEKAHEANEKAFALQGQARHDGRTHADAIVGGASRELRFVSSLPNTLDPGHANDTPAGMYILNLFAGLVEIDSDMNVVPHVARSWEVLDGGRRLVFYLRDDVHWTNGEQVTATDFEWAWKRNLRLNDGQAANLDAILGAREFRLGNVTDPDSVGVDALNTFTLQVRLSEPTPFFPFILGLAIAFPLPRQAIETHGDDWWRPGNIVSNGAFRLVEYEAEAEKQQFKFTIERNVEYFGEFPGNITQARYIPRSWRVESQDELSRMRGRQYLAGEFDLMWFGPPVHPETGEPIITAKDFILHTGAILLNPSRAPLDDVRVRRALFLALDRGRMQGKDDWDRQHPADGGLIPPGMAGHSPGIGLPHDLKAAQSLLADAGFPEGKGFRPLEMFRPSGWKDVDNLRKELILNWHDALGIEIIWREGLQDTQADAVLWGWTTDYPDPDSIMRVWLAPLHQEFGRADETSFQLIEQAAHMADRGERLALYRRQDYHFVVEQALFYPRFYGRRGLAAKPWIKGARINPLGWMYFKNIVMEPH